MSSKDAAAKIQTIAPHLFNQASNGKRSTKAARAVVTYLSIKEASKNDMQLIRSVVDANQLLYATNSDLALDKMIRRTKEILHKGFPGWQTLRRAIYIEFGFDRDFFGERYLRPRRAERIYQSADPDIRKSAFGGISYINTCNLVDNTCYKTDEAGSQGDIGQIRGPSRMVPFEFLGAYLGQA